MTTPILSRRAPGIAESTELRTHWATSGSKHIWLCDAFGEPGPFRLNRELEVAVFEYAKVNCPECLVAHDWLQEHGVPYWKSRYIPYVHPMYDADFVALILSWCDPEGDAWPNRD